MSFCQGCADLLKDNAALKEKLEAAMREWTTMRADRDMWKAESEERRAQAERMRKDAAVVEQARKDAIAWLQDALALMVKEKTPGIQVKSAIWCLEQAALTPAPVTGQSDEA